MAVTVLGDSADRMLEDGSDPIGLATLRGEEDALEPFQPNIPRLDSNPGVRREFVRRARHCRKPSGQCSSKYW